MKTAEEWLTETDVSHPNTDLVKLVEQIQLDAMKEGYKRAANEVEGFDFTESVTLAADLRAASEQLTIKDLEV